MVIIVASLVKKNLPLFHVVCVYTIHALLQEKREIKVVMLLFSCMTNLMENFPRKSIQLLISYQKNIYSLHT